MAGCRLFRASTEEIVFSSSGSAEPTNAFSMAVLAKPTGVSGTQILLEGRRAAGDALIYLNGSVLTASWEDEGFITPTTEIRATAETWQVFGLSFAGIGNVFRFHRLVLGGAATHTSSSRRVEEVPRLGEWSLGPYSFGGSQFLGRIAAAGIWNRALSDAEFEAMATWIGMMKSAPRAIWRLDGEPSFVDQTGRNNDQASIRGTSHDSNEPTSFWPVATRGESWRGFGSGNWPTASWKPYRAEGVWNRAIDPRVDVVHENSAAIIADVLAFSGQPERPVGNLVAGGADTTRDFAHPLYFARTDDPLFRLSLTKVSEWGANEIDGVEIRIPNDARPAGGNDGHMCIVTPEGWEYDLWQVREKPSGGGRLVCSWGGRIRVDGSGIGSAGTASHFGLAAGTIRGIELQERLIDHALFAVVSVGSIDLSFGYGVRRSDEENGTYVFPAEYGDARAPAEVRNAPPMGARFWLDMRAEAIEALSVPDWKKTILKALARYGAYFGDTGGPGFGFQFESGTTYTSFGVTDPLVSYAADNRLTIFEDIFVFELSSGVEWSRYLKVVIPPRP